MPFHSLRYTLPALLLTTALSAQTPVAPRVTTQYWVSAGAGISQLWDDNNWIGTTGPSMTFAASVQHGVLVASVRSARFEARGKSGWDLGLIAGAGSPSRFPVRGSVGAGLGITTDTRGHSGVTIPLELQLGWRLTSSFGFGTYLFGNLGGPAQTFGAAVGIQVGKLR
jgi:hypothetical protein